MSEYDVLAHGDTLPAVPLPVEPVDVVQVEVAAPMPVEPVEPDFAALIERERERLQDAEAELDRVLTETVWDGMGKTIARAEEAVTIIKRKIRSLELRRLEAMATADAKREAARRAHVEEVAAEVDGNIDELAERLRAFGEAVETAKGALRDAAALADKIKRQRRSVRLRANNNELEAFETGRALPSYALPQLLERVIAAFCLDLVQAFPGVPSHVGITRDDVMLARPIPRDFTVPLARVRRGFVVDPAVAMAATGKFGGQRPADDDDAE